MATKSRVKTTTFTQAIRTRIPRLAIANAAYKTNVVTVNTYVNNVLTASLPVVPVQPKDWQAYITAWEAACGDALTWVNQCMARLLTVPQDVQSYNSIIALLLGTAVTQTNALIANPNDQAALAALTNALNTIPGQLTVVETFISGAVQALQNFQDVLPAMAGQLQNLSNLAIADNNADQAQIATLQADVTRLQNDINSLTAAIVALAIADGIALTMGIIASIAAFPVGLLTWFVLGPIVAVATTFIALDAKQIEADKAAIQQDQTQMSELTAACSVLATMSTTYSGLANQSQTIQTALQAVLTEWQAMSADVAAAIVDIQTAITDTGAASYQAVLADLQGAQTEWQAADTQAAGLVLDINVNNAQLQIGMSQSAVQQTLAGGQVSDLLTYFNSVGLNGNAVRRTA